MLGDQLLVAPVANPGDPARKQVWFPPGRWVDMFTGRLHGLGARVLSVPLEQMPVFARAGAIVVRQPYADFERPGGNRLLLVDVYAGADGGFELYEDAGAGFGYENGEFARTGLRWRQDGRGGRLEIGGARGGYPGDLAQRTYEVAIKGIDRPGSVTLTSGPTRQIRDFHYDNGRRVLSIGLTALPTGRPATIRVEPAPRGRR